MMMRQRRVSAINVSSAIECAAVVVDPRIIRIYPIPAVRKLLAQTSYRLEDVELIKVRHYTYTLRWNGSSA